MNRVKVSTPLVGTVGATVARGTSSQDRLRLQRTRSQHEQAGGPQVAIIGGGVSGLACAQKLKELGICATIFDTGKRAPGGRCSSREIVHEGQTLHLDHSMQCFSSSSDAFDAVVMDWVHDGVVREWKRSVVGTLGPSGEFQPRSDEDPPLYVGVEQGNRAIIEHLSKGLDICRPVWVDRVQRQPSGKWEVHKKDDFHGAFDYLVIAHNGKCADRLMSKGGVPAIHKLLKVKFQPSASHHQVMQLCSLWVLMVVFPRSLGLAFEGCYVQGSQDLSWIANNTAKLSTSPLHPREEGQPECWTLISTRAFGAQHKVHQEFVPRKKDREVKQLLLESFERAVGQEFPEPVFMKAQLWGAAVPMNVLDTPHGCVFDADACVGICGDWIISPSMEGAFLSGQSLAETVQAHAEGSREASTGLDSSFRVLRTGAVGDLGSNMKDEERDDVLMEALTNTDNTLTPKPSRIAAKRRQQWRMNIQWL